MLVGACGMASILQPLTHSLFFRYTCRHRALNPLLVPRCVRCDVERRCWRISRNAILQGGKRGAIWGQRGGKYVNSKTFHLPGGWVRALLSEPWARLEWGGTEEMTGKVVAIDWPVTSLRSHRWGLNELIILLLLLAHTQRNVSAVLQEKKK